MRIILIGLILICLFGCEIKKDEPLPNWFTKDWFAEYKANVVALEHPFEDLSEIFPFVNTWDDITSITAGISWVRVKDKRTNDEYEMVKGTNTNQWLFKKSLFGLYKDSFLEKEIKWQFTGELPDWLEILPWEIEWREKELKRLKERKYD